MASPAPCGRSRGSKPRSASTTGSTGPRSSAPWTWPATPAGPPCGSGSTRRCDARPGPAPGPGRPSTVPLLRQLGRRLAERDVARAHVHHVFVLAPEERPNLAVLGEVGLEDQHPGHDPAGDEREVGAIAAIGDFLRD